MRTYYIYALSDPRDGETRYVGKTHDYVERFRSHIRAAHAGNPKREGNLWVSRWIRSLLSEGFTPVMCVSESSKDHEYILKREIEIIEEYRGHSSLTNHARGGRGSTGFKMSDATRNLLSTIRKGKPCPWMNGNKTFLGRTHSQETKDKLRAQRVGKKRPPFSEECLRNMSKAKMGNTIKKDYLNRIASEPPNSETR